MRTRALFLLLLLLLLLAWHERWLLQSTQKADPAQAKQGPPPTTARPDFPLATRTRMDSPSKPLGASPAASIKQPTAAPGMNSPEPPGFALIEGHKVHPTRLLVKKRPGVDVPANADLLSRFGYGLEHEFSARTGWLLLDVPQAHRDPVSPDAAEARGRELQAKIAALNQAGLFASVQPDIARFSQLEPNDEAFRDGRLWGLRNTGQNGGVPGADINVMPAWDLTTGSTNVLVAVIDTGVSLTHRDLVDQLWRNPGEIEGNGIDDDGNGYIDDVHGMNALWPQDSARAGNPADDHQHGTHCAGTIGAAANNGYAHVGVAWQVRIMGLKFLDANGSGFDSDAIQCIEYAVANHAQVLSCSWGGSEYSQPLYDAFAAAGTAGVLVVTAAGNARADLDKIPFYPAAFDLDNLVCVAALDRQDRLAWFSNFGFRTAHLAAPGMDILSCDAFDDRGYVSFSGTSMACPHVSGVAALVKAYYPSISPHDWRQRLIATAAPVSDLLGRTASGGRVNAFAALTSQADGILELNVAVRDTMPAVFGGTNVPALVVNRTNMLVVGANDLAPITNASVRARIGAGEWFDLRNDGVPPDEVASDGLYSGLFLTSKVGFLDITVEVTAPGKVSQTRTRTFLVVAPPSNDAFDQRQLLFGDNLEVQGTTTGAGRAPGEPAHNGTPIGHSVWYEWVAPASGWLTLNVSGSNSFPGRVVYTGIDVQSLIPQSSFWPSWAQGHVFSWVSDSLGPYYQIEQGHAYLIAVENLTAAVGSFTLQFTLLRGDPPALPPVFTAQPRDLVQEAGSQAFFRAEVMSPTPVTYSWLLNNVPIPFQNNREMKLRSISATNEGVYFLVASNIGGVVTSTPVRLTVVAPALQTDLFDDFESDIHTREWFSVEQGIYANDYGGSVSGTKSLWFASDGSGQIATRALNTTNGGIIRFWLRFGSESPLLSRKWARPNDPKGTGASVGYSVEGIGGTTFATFYSTNFLAWRQIELPIPPEAQLPSVHFTWNGPGYDGDDGNWALDDVQVILFTNAQPPSIIHDLADITVMEGTFWKLQFDVRGVAPMHFAWYRDGVGLGNDRSTYSQTAQTNQTGFYQVVVTNGLGTVQSRLARVTAVPEPSIAQALDATNLTFSVGPITGGRWRGFLVGSHDSEDVLQSPVLDEDILFPRLETTVQGPGVFKFWWKASGNQGYGQWRFAFFLDDAEEAHLAGQTEWQQAAIDVLSGTHVLRWDSPDEDYRARYQAEAQLWLDQVSYTPLPPSAPEIISVTSSRELNPYVMEGIPVSFSVRARGDALAYQWRHAGTNIPGANQAELKFSSVTPALVGLYTVIVSNALGIAESSAVNLHIATAAEVGAELANAFDTTNLVWDTDQEFPWFRQTNVIHDGLDAGSSATSSNDLSSWVETQITGPGLLSFWWKVSSEPGFDQFVLLDNNRPVAFQDGEVDWNFRTVELENGTHTLRWIYDKDDSGSEALDRAWLDQVTFTPGPISTPRPLDAALDTTNLVWTTSLPYSWLGQTNLHHDGVDAAASGMSPRNSDNWLQTAVQGPSTLTFWWKISAQPFFDELRLLLDNNQLLKIDGEVDWQFMAIPIPAGTHAIRWAFNKGTLLAGANMAWVDEVRVVPLTTRFLSVGKASDGHLQLDMEGPLGRRVVIDASTNLVQWSPITTNLINSAGRASINLPTFPTIPSRFYRATVFP